MMCHLRYWRRNLAQSLHKTKRDQSLAPCLARKKLRRVKNRFHQLRLLQITSLTLVVQLQSFHRGWFRTEWRLKSLGMLTLNQSTSHCIWVLVFRHSNLIYCLVQAIFQSHWITRELLICNIKIGKFTLHPKSLEALRSVLKTWRSLNLQLLLLRFWFQMSTG